MAEKQSTPAPRSGNRPSPVVYRRRRLVALIGMLIVIGLLAWGGTALASLFSGPPQQQQPQQPGTAATEPVQSTEVTPESPEPSGACHSGDIVVAASTEKTSYGAEEKPVLVMSIENKGSTPCEINVGTSMQEFSVTSGSDRIFSTSDCRADAKDYMLTMEPGTTESAKFTWLRDRSAPGCGSIAAKPRPGTYVFTAKLGDVASNKAPFLLQ